MSIIMSVLDTALIFIATLGLFIWMCSGGFDDEGKLKSPSRAVIMLAVVFIFPFLGLLPPPPQIGSVEEVAVSLTLFVIFAIPLIIIPLSIIAYCILNSRDAFPEGNPFAWRNLNVGFSRPTKPDEQKPNSSPT